MQNIDTETILRQALDDTAQYITGEDLVLQLIKRIQLLNLFWSS